MSSWLLSDFTFTCVLVDFLFEPIVSGHLWCCAALFADTPAVSPCLSSFPLIFLCSFFLFTVDSLQGLRFSARMGGLSVWSLIVLSMPVWFLLVHSGVPPRCKDNIVRLTRDSKSSLRCGCEHACLFLHIRPAIDWQLVLPRLLSYDTQHRLHLPRCPECGTSSDGKWMDGCSDALWLSHSDLFRVILCFICNTSMLVLVFELTKMMPCICIYACLDVWLHAFWAV